MGTHVSTALPASLALLLGTQTYPAFSQHLTAVHAMPTALLSSAHSPAQLGARAAATQGAPGHSAVSWKTSWRREHV